MTVLFTTITGSHMYGLAHANSDNDKAIILVDSPEISQKRFTQEFIGNDDIQTFTFNKLLSQALRGVPSALEIMWSTKATPSWADSIRFSIRPKLGGAISRHHGYILNSLKQLDSKSDLTDYKRMKIARHCARWALNANKLYLHGIYNPTLTQSEIDFLNGFRELHADTGKLRVELNKFSIFPI